MWVISSLLNRYVFSFFRINMSTNDQLRDMQKQLHDMNKKLSKEQPPARKRKKDGDYIDYEEIS